MKTKQLLLTLLAFFLPLTTFANVWQDPETKVWYGYTVGSSSAHVIHNMMTEYVGDIAILSKFTVGSHEYNVTSIDDSAFFHNTGLTSVTIPSSVTSIGGSAFSGCTGLTKVTIPSSIISIGWSAFQGCTGLTRVTIHDIAAWCGIEFGNPSANPLYFARHLFINDKEIKDFAIPSNVTSIGSYAFSGCTSLTSITIPSTLASIGSSVFSGCTGLTSITIPSTLTSIGSSAFSDCTGLTNVTINCKEVGSWFCNNKSITKVTLGENVTKIDNSAFSGLSGLTNITIPENVTYIGSSAFASCSALKSIEVKSGNKVYDSRENCNAIISTAYNRLIVGCQNTIIPSSVTRIGNEAFYGCSSLTSINIPEGVTIIGSSAFERCSGLSSVTIPSTVTSIDTWAFRFCTNLASFNIPASVTYVSNAFESTAWYNNQDDGPLYLDNWLLGYKGEKPKGEFVLPKGTVGIASSALSYSRNLTSLSLPESLFFIGQNAFNNCTGLTTLTIPASVKSIGHAAFDNCTNLNTITSHAKEPFNLDTSAFNFYIWPSITLYVPAASLDAYKSTYPWSRFGTIKAIEEEGEQGDVNGDTAIDVADIGSVIDYMTGSESIEMKSADVNHDETVDVADIATIIDIMASPHYEYCTFEEDGMDGIFADNGLYALLQHTPDSTGYIFTNGNIHDDLYSCILFDSLGYARSIKTSDNRLFKVFYSPNEMWLIDSEGNIIAEIPYNEFSEVKGTHNSRKIRKAWAFTSHPVYKVLSIGNTIKGFLEDRVIAGGLMLLDYISSGYGTRHHELFSKMVSLGFGLNDLFAWIESLEKLEEEFYFGNASITALDAIPWEHDPCCFITPCKVEGLSTSTSAFTNIKSRYEELLHFSYDLKMSTQTSATPHKEQQSRTIYNIPSNGTFDDFVFDYDELQTKYDYEPSLTLNMTIKRLSSEIDGAVIFYYDPLRTNKYDVIQRSCTIYGKPNSLVTGSVSSSVEKVENPKTTTADVICSFSDVPDGAECLVKVNIKGSDFSFLYHGKPGVKSQTVKATNLQMNTSYVASTYISYNGKDYDGVGSVEFSTSGPSGAVISVDDASITKTSAVAICQFSGVESGVECGVIAKSSTQTLTFPAAAKEGEQRVSMSGLTPSTQYKCYAYLKGSSFYKEQSEGVTFTTKSASLAGTWSCTVTKSGGGTESLTIVLTEDGFGYGVVAGDSRDYQATWSFGSDGQASINVGYVSTIGFGGLSYSTYNFWGKVDNLENPSQIDGNGSYAIGNAIAESGYDFKFSMSK